NKIYYFTLTSFTMNKPWIYTTNFILSACENNFANAIRLSAFHLSALHVASASDAAILAMYNTYLPLDTSLVTAYGKWKTQEGSQKGSTLSFAQLLNGLTNKLNAWDPAIQSVYVKTSSAYKAIFPKGRKPFQTGTQDERKAAVAALANALTGITALATTRTDVVNYLNLLNTAQTGKYEANQQTNNFSDAVRAAILTMATQQFANFGALINKYPSTPTKVDTFFDLDNIRSHQQTDFTHTLAPGKTYVIAKRTVKATDSIRIFNTGDTVIRFYFGETQKSAPGTVFVDSQPGTNVIVPVSQLGDIAHAHYFISANQDEQLEGSFEVELP
ncbi:MAG: hypothetical protein K2Q22_10640, partial [Cytophagales bacterium]|nr:hypothetical protein [Cytophagales bacterium]